MSAVGTLFFSYRRSQLDTVRPVVDALRRAGVKVFFDQDAIDPLASFPEKIQQGIAASHALLAWWSLDYGESDHCLAEYRLAWSHARRHSADVAQRLWVLNPEANAGHISAGEANASNFLRPPKAGEEQAWAERLRDKLQALLPCGLLNDERQLPPVPVRYPNPFPRDNRHFTGRNRELMRIHSLLHPPRIGGQACNVALHAHGLGGIGKTELALQYARQFQAAYPGGVYWLNLAGFDPARFSAADRIEDNAKHAWAHAVHSVLGEQIGLTVDGENKPFPADVLRQKLVEHFAERQDFLWIVDNVPPIQPADRRERILAYWQAPATQGRTLITSRDPLPLAGYTPLALERLSDEDSQRLLAQYRSPRTEAEKCACTEIASQLGGHPLALTLAGHALDCVHGNSERPYADLLHELTTRAAVPALEDLAERMRPELGDKASGILASIELSVRTLSEAAWQLLKLAATCASNLPIPKALLALAYHPDDPSRAPTRELLRVGLLQELSDDTRVRMHPLVAEAGFALLMVTAAEREKLQEEMAHALLARLQDEEAQRASISREDDAELARELVEVLRDETAWELGWYASTYYSVRGKYDFANKILLKLLGGFESIFGAGHPDTLAIKNNIALNHHGNGEFSTACKIYEDMLSNEALASESEIFSRLVFESNFANVLLALNERVRACTLQSKVLREMLSMPNKHLEALKVMNSFACALEENEYFSMAMKVHQCVFRARATLLGREHPDTLTAMGNLAIALRKTGKSVAAQRLEEEVLLIRKRIQGIDHQNTLIAMNNLAITLAEQNECSKAANLLSEAKSHINAVFGKNHPHVSIFTANLMALLTKDPMP